MRNAMCDGRVIREPHQVADEPWSGAVSNPASGSATVNRSTVPRQAAAHGPLFRTGVGACSLSPSTCVCICLRVCKPASKSCSMPNAETQVLPPADVNAMCRCDVTKSIDQTVRDATAASRERTWDRSQGCGADQAQPLAKSVRRAESSSCSGNHTRSRHFTMPHAAHLHHHYRHH